MYKLYYQGNFCVLKGQNSAPFQWKGDFFPILIFFPNLRFFNFFGGLEFSFSHHTHKLHDDNLLPLHLILSFNFLMAKVCAIADLFLIDLDWLQSLKQMLINVSYHILVASLSLMALS